jgi:hypothetical protein
MTAVADVAALVAEWDRHEAGIRAAGNVSRRGMRSWGRIDRGFNRGHYIAVLLAEAHGFQREEPAQIGQRETTVAGEALREIEDSVCRRQPYRLKPDERALALAYWRERLALVGRMREVGLAGISRCEAARIRNLLNWQERWAAGVIVELEARP